MAVFESKRYPELGFYVNGGRRQFSGGLFSTEDPAEVAVLSGITGVTIAESTEEAPKDPVKEPPKPRTTKPKE